MEDWTNKLINGDCLEVMKRIPPASVDMILADLPYATTQNAWDSLIPLDLLWAEYKRVAKNNAAIVLTAQTPFDKVLGCSNLEMLKYEWIWEKTESTGFLNAKKMPLKSHENVLVFYRALPTYNPQMTPGKPYKYKKDSISSTNYGNSNGTDLIVNDGKRYPKSILVFQKDKGLHSTQKPVSLFQCLIRTYTNEGDLVLDSCCGSATTAIAAIKANRRYICIEKDLDYYSAAVERIKAYRVGTESNFESLFE
jgi:site-specific DNA-methyltransferase (adenine-specific)